MVSMKVMIWLSWLVWFGNSQSDSSLFAIRFCFVIRWASLCWWGDSNLSMLWSCSQEKKVILSMPCWGIWLVLTMKRFCRKFVPEGSTLFAQVLHCGLMLGSQIWLHWLPAGDTAHKPCLDPWLWPGCRLPGRAFPFFAKNVFQTLIRNCLMSASRAWWGGSTDEVAHLGLGSDLQASCLAHLSLWADLVGNVW